MNTIVAEVIEELDAHRARYEALCRSLSEEQLDRPVPQSAWLVRDYMAHLATIDGPVGQMFRAMHEGGDPGIRDGDGGRWDVDDWNERQVQARRARSVEEVLTEAAEARAELKRHLAALTGEDLAKTLTFGGDAKRPPSALPLGVYLKGWCKHDPMHAMDMARALPEAMTPELEAWFDDPVIRGYQAMMNTQQG